MVINMMNYIFSFMIISSLIYSIITNNLDNITNGMFDSTTQTIELTLTMFGIIPLWTGIMNIVSNTKILDYLTKIVSPIISKIFRNVDKNTNAYKYICINFTSNLLGLGNASTPLGLKAVSELEKTNDNESILKLILINTAAIQLIPSTIIALRSLLGSTNPNGIILQIWCCSVISLTSALILYKLLGRKEKNT